MSQHVDTQPTQAEIENRIKFYTYPTQFGNTTGSGNAVTLSDVQTTLKNTYGSGSTVKWAVIFTLYNDPAGTDPNGIYLGIYVGQMSNNVRFTVYNKSSGYINLAQMEADISNKMNKSLGNISTVDSVSLYGSGFYKDTNVSGLPTTSGKYYEILAFGTGQIAICYGNGGSSCTWTRHHANNQWYVWRRIDKPDVETGTVVSVITLYDKFVKKSGNVVHLGIEVNGGYSPNTKTHIATVPEGFRPNHRITICAPVDPGSGVPNGYALVMLDTDGKVYMAATIVNFVSIYFTYVINS